MAWKRSSTLRSSTAFRFARRVARPLRRAVRGRAGPRAGILMYHRVAREESDPWGLCVSPGNFEAQMAVLAERRAQTDLAELLGPAGFAPNGQRLAVTFDDGYIDNITHALPVLERYEIPATFFVVAGALGRNREFWWDGLERAVLGPVPLPAALSMRLDGRQREFVLDEAPDDWSAISGWRADHHDAVTSRQALFLDLWNEIVRLTPSAQEETVDFLLDWAGLPLAPPRGRTAATAEDIARVARHPLIRIASHTFDHVSLPGMPPHAQRDQIERGHHRLEDIIGTRISSFSYPFGRYDECARACVRELKIDLACTSREGTATPRSDPLALPRLQVEDSDGERFARWLRDEHGLLAASGARK
jgi:peptidoglycan/xylan/chitin deacetylase (PgdA/CDA1 family)